MAGSAWSTFTINKKYVGTRTEKSILIKMPDDSIYEGYSTWLSAKLVREQGSNNYSIAMRPGFDVILRMILKDSNGNYITADTKRISGLEFSRAFTDREDDI